MLHDYPGGTFQWLESTLRELQKYGPKQIILLQHHPLSSTSTQPAFVRILDFNSRFMGSVMKRGID